MIETIEKRYKDSWFKSNPVYPDISLEVRTNDLFLRDNPDVSLSAKTYIEITQDGETYYVKLETKISHETFPTRDIVIEFLNTVQKLAEGAKVNYVVHGYEPDRTVYKLEKGE